MTRVIHRLAVIAATGMGTAGLAAPAAAEELSLSDIAQDCAPTITPGSLAEMRDGFVAKGWEVLPPDAGAEAFEPYYQAQTLLSIAGGGEPGDGLSATLAQEPERSAQMAEEYAFLRETEESGGQVAGMGKAYLRHPESGAQLYLSVGLPQGAICVLSGTDLDLEPIPGAETPGPIPMTDGSQMVLGAGGLLDYTVAALGMPGGTRGAKVVGVAVKPASRAMFEDAGYTVIEAYGIGADG